MPSFNNNSIQFFRLATKLLLGVTLLFPLTLLGEEQTVTPAVSSVPETQRTVLPAESTIPQAEQAEHFEYMEAPRDYLSGKVTSFASYLDHLFGGDRHFQESNQSVLQLNLTRVTGYGGDKSYKLAARMKLKLPITEWRLRLLVETDPENNLTDEPITSPPVTNRKVSVPSTLALAVRYEKKEDVRWYFNTDVGIKFRGIAKAPNPFVRARSSYTAPIGQWRLKASESVYWFNTTGLGETTLLDLDRIVSAQFLFRATSSAIWLYDTQNFSLRQNMTLFHTLSDRSALSYQASVIGASEPQLRVTDYVLQLFYRYRMNREWLFFEFNPQLHFPREQNYNSSPTLNVRLEMLFDESR